MHFFTDEHQMYEPKPFVKITSHKYHAAMALLKSLVSSASDNGETDMDDIIEAIKLLDEGAIE